MEDYGLIPQVVWAERPLCLEFFTLNHPLANTPAAAKLATNTLFHEYRTHDELTLGEREDSQVFQQF